MIMAKKRVAVLFGGVSSEYEISCISAAAIIENMSGDKYEVLKVGITKKGRWLLYPGPVEKMRDCSWEQFPDCVPAVLTPDRTDKGLMVNHGGRLDVVKLDAVFPALHGRNGEDGTVQGLLELAGIPYVGCDVISSAMCMDKASANLVFDSVGLAHTPWMVAGRAEMDDFEGLIQRVLEKLSYPVFVKPSVGGSSVGITKAHNEAELRDAVMLASAHDQKIVFEQAVEGHEVEVAVLGNRQLTATLPGEVESCNEIYDYEAKYHSGDASKLHLPALLAPQKLEEVRQMALRAYTVMGCTGLARVDFFVEHGTERVLLNEINTMPGFTSTSMYPKLMEMNGLAFPQLVDKLIELAFERFEA